jgi:hypothetical protein
VVGDLRLLPQDEPHGFLHLSGCHLTSSTHCGCGRSPIN